MIIIEKILTAILSSIVLAIFLPLNSDYFSSVILVSLTVFLVGGIPFSLSVDYFMEKNNFENRFYKYIVSFVLYGLGGILIISIFILLQGNISDIVFGAMLMLGVLPGLIYYHLSLLLTTLLFRNKG